MTEKKSKQYHNKHLYNYTIRSVKTKKKARNVNRSNIFFRKSLKYYKIVAVLIFIVLFVYGMYKYYLSADMFMIQDTEITGARNFVNKEDVKNLVEEQSLKKHIKDVDTGYIEAILSESFQGAKEITVTKKYPNTISVQVEERKPLAILSSKKEEDFYLVDDVGYILGNVDDQNTNLPKVLYSGPLHVGYTIDVDLIPLYLDLISSIDENKLRASSISVDTKHIDFYIDGIQVLIGKNKDVSTSVTVVAELYKQLKLEGKDVKKIDLRYDKVIVKYE